jgi:hypothetical protein
MADGEKEARLTCVKPASEVEEEEGKVEEERVMKECREDKLCDRISTNLSKKLRAMSPKLIPVQ